jgi:hypothetical protein
MNQADLTVRFDALQERLMTLYEEGRKTIDAQIEYWQLIRKESVLMYYGRKEGFKNFGLQPLPALTVSEYKAKEAIRQVLLLKSLKNSVFGNEEWTLPETSAELTYTAPRNTFKKDPYTVDVWFDHNPDNSFPYTNWNKIYFQDDHDNWHRAAGKVDINGLYFEDANGDKSYFVVFASDAQRYGTTGEWTVHYKNETISSTSLSSQRSLSTISSQGSVSSSRDSIPAKKGQSTRRHQSEEGIADSSSSSTSSSPSAVRRGRRRPQQGEHTSRGGGTRAKRQRTEEVSTTVSPNEVGRGNTSVPRTNLTRLERLAKEARDPPIVLIKGRSNPLKCWRYRCEKHCDLYDRISTVFKWVNSTNDCNMHRLLISFKNQNQRSMFLKFVNLPKGCTFSLGSLDSI